MCEQLKYTPSALGIEGTVGLDGEDPICAKLDVDLGKCVVRDGVGEAEREILFIIMRGCIHITE